MASVLSSQARNDWSWSHGRDALRMLLRAHECASDFGSDDWEFAVEITHLHDSGLSDIELRWLLKMDYVSHRIEATLLGDQTRCFLSAGGVKFTPESCFTLTVSGEAYVRNILNLRLSHAHGTTFPDRSIGTHDAPQQTSPVEMVSCALRPEMEIEAGLPMASPLHLAQPPLFDASTLPKDQSPAWDADRKELWFGPLLIKRFRFQSPNQETILAVFHEENWPVRIDDPLPPVPNQTSRQRLHDAVKNLNRHRLNRAIRFAGDGTGEGVRWEREG